MRLLRKKPAAPAARRPINDQPEASPAYKYRSRRSAADVKTGRGVFKGSRSIKKQRPWHKLLAQRFGLVILFIVFLVCVVNALILSGQPKIVLLSPDSRLYLHQADVYQKSAEQILKASILSTNKITVDTGGISRRLLSEYPELSSVSVTLPLLAHRPIVYLSPAQPSIILVGANGSFVLDNRGRALLRSNNAASFSYLKVPLVVDHSNLHIVLNRLALTSDNVNFIQTIAYQLLSKSISVSSMVLPAGGSELDVNIGGQPYFVKFNLQNNDARQQVGTYLAAMTRLQSKGVTPTSYVDVRTDGRAYYK